MIILAVVKDEKRKATRGRGRGNDIHYKVGIGVDNYNIMIADTTSDVWVGRKFNSNFSSLWKWLPDFDVDQDKAKEALKESLSAIFDEKLPKKMTIAEIDKKFAISKRREDSTGILRIFDALKNKVNSETGDLVLA